MIVHKVLTFQLFPFARTILHPHFGVVKICDNVVVVVVHSGWYGVRKMSSSQLAMEVKFRVNFEVADAKRPILSVNRVRTLDRSQSSSLAAGKIFRDAASIPTVANVDETERFNVIQEKGAYVLGKTSQSSSELHVQPVNSNNKRTSLEPMGNEHERRRTLETEENENDLDQPYK